MLLETMQRRKKIAVLFDRPALERLSSYANPSRASVGELRTGLIHEWDIQFIKLELAKLVDRAS